MLRAVLAMLCVQSGRRLYSVVEVEPVGQGLKKNLVSIVFRQTIRSKNISTFGVFTY